jgi:hypothetical protein
MKKPNHPYCDLNDVTFGSSAVFFKMKIEFLGQGQQQQLRPVAFRPHLTAGLVLLELNNLSQQGEQNPIGSKARSFLNFSSWSPHK